MKINLFKCCWILMILLSFSETKSQLLISELMYHPKEVDLPYPNYEDREDAEFLELWNSGTSNIDISLFSFNGISYCFPLGTNLGAGQRLVLAKNATVFQNVYGFSAFDTYEGKLSNSGELIQLFNNQGGLISQINYKDHGEWPTKADGLGPSLELVCSGCDTELFSNWEASSNPSEHTAGNVNSTVISGNRPSIDSIVFSNTSPEPGELVTISAYTHFASSVDLIYSINFGIQQTISGTFTNGKYTFVLPSFAANDYIQYHIIANNMVGEYSSPRADEVIENFSLIVNDPLRAPSQFPIINWHFNGTNPNNQLTVIEYNGTIIYNAFSWWRRNKHWKIELPKGQTFEMLGYTTLAIDEFQLNKPDHAFSGWVNGTMARTAVFTPIFGEEGEPALDAFNVRVDINGQYGKIWTFLTWPDGNWRTHIGIEEGHEYYKFSSSVVSGVPNPKLKFPEGGSTDSVYDLIALKNTVGPHLMDVYDIPKMVNFAALSTLICHWDAGTKNFYMHKHPNGRWEGDMWDVDASPRTGVAGLDSTWCKCAEMPEQHNPHPNNSGNIFAKPLLANQPRVRAMYERRLRTLIDKYYAPGELIGRVMEQADPNDSDINYTANSYSSNHNITVNQQHIFVDYPSWQLVRYNNRLGFPQSASGLTNIVINEIQYAPQGGDSEEFIELYNNSAESVDISGWHLEGVSLTFPYGTVILPNDFLVVASWSPDFINKYGSGKYVAADFGSSHLNNDSETIRLLKPDGTVEDELAYGGANWKGAYLGHSLERISYTGPSGDPSNWAPSSTPFGTPDAENSPDPLADYSEPSLDSNLVINEIMYHPSPFGDFEESSLDFIELINTSSSVIDADNIKLKGINYTFPEGSQIQAGAIIVLASDKHSFLVKYGFEPYDNYEGTLSNAGEELTLVSATGIIIDFVKFADTNPWDEAPDGTGPSLELLHPSFDNSDPLSWFRSDIISGTPGQQNSRVCNQNASSIVINEINYNSNNTVFDPGDWVELYNSGTTSVDLSNWSFYDNFDEFILPQGTIIEPDEYLILAENTISFGQSFPHMSVDGFIGDLGFKLNNESERISLFDSGKCLSDYVIYQDSLPWKDLPDGNGPTLSLIDPALSNELPESWDSSSDIDAANGTPGRSNTPCPEVELIHQDTVCLNKSYVFKTIPIDGVRNEWTFPFGTPATYIGDSVEVSFAFIFPIQVELHSYFAECEQVQTCIVTVLECNDPPVAINDNYSTEINNAISGNVTENDYDIVPGSFSTSLATNPSSGNLMFNTDGTFTYQPNPGFIGQDNFIYWLCDDGFEGTCMIGFVVLEVTEPCINLDVSLWLEAAYDLDSNKMIATLNESRKLLPGMINNMTQNGQPYNIPPWNYTGQEGDNWIDSNYVPEVVDWVLLSFRTTPFPSSEEYKTAALLYTNGQVEVLNPCALSVLTNPGYYIVVEHRNHMAAMTPGLVSVINRSISYDFRNGEAYNVGGAGQKEISSGVWAMYGADGSQINDLTSYDINGNDKNEWELFNGTFEQYDPLDFNMDGDVNGMDRLFWSKNNGIFSAVLR